MNWYKQASFDEFVQALKFLGIAVPTTLLMVVLIQSFGGKEEAIQAIQKDPQAAAQVVQQEMQQNAPAQIEQEPIQPEPKTQPEPKKEISEDENFVARVIFSEAAGTSKKERELVAASMINRMNHPGFGRGKLSSMRDVAEQPRAYSAINGNKLWYRSEHPEQFEYQPEIDAWEHSLQLATGGARPLNGPSGNPIVYYHDGRVDKPSSWDNSWWNANLEIETDQFKFYSVTPSRN